jgi:hypothetical protein
MKGIVFNLLSEMVEEKFGLQAWDAVLDKAGSEGLYVATETYADEELLALVAAGSELTGIPANDLVRAFGQFMIPRFAEHYSVFFEGHANLKEFLLTVDSVIHVEVRKLYPEAGLPEFTYDDGRPDKLTMMYRSPRKLCALAEGLIEGSAAHFDQPCTIYHEVCMHKGADHCALELEFTR